MRNPSSSMCFMSYMSNFRVHMWWLILSKYLEEGAPQGRKRKPPPNPSLRSMRQYSHSPTHYNDVIMGAIASKITSLTIVYSTVYSGTDQRKYQSSASLAFVHGIHRWSVNSPHKWQVTRKMFPFGDVIMTAMVLIVSCIMSDLFLKFH